MPDLPRGRHEHMNAINSEHSKNDVSCISCHSPHHSETKEFMLVKAQPELCYTCHLQQRAQFEMPFHHRVNEGLSSAAIATIHTGPLHQSKCGLPRLRMRFVFKCHTDKQGPFVYRALAGEGGRVPDVSHGPRRPESAHAESQQRQLALLAVPHDINFQFRAGRSVVPQPIEPISGVHSLPRRDSRV